MAPIRHRGGRRGGQRGVVLMVALIVLIGMTLAALGMMRSLDTGTLVAGNISYRQSAVATADTAIERARAWMITNELLLQSDNPSAGYYSTRQDALDITGNKTEGGTDGVDWGGTDPNQPVKSFNIGTLDATGNTASYLIHRLCTLTGSPNAPLQSCAVQSTVASASTQGTPDYSTYGLQVKNVVYYRITARVNGPKNTVSYVQAFILL
jgi:Tfp pilus assembly protein PilX